MLATAQQLLTDLTDSYPEIDQFGFDADDYAAISDFLDIEFQTPEWYAVLLTTGGDN